MSLPLESEISRRQFLGFLGAGLVSSTILGTSGCTDSSIRPSTAVPDLGLDIDERAFLAAARSGPKLGIITQASDKNKMDHLKPYGDFWIAEASPNFTVAINRPMADFIVQKAGLANPSLPTRMMIVEEKLSFLAGATSGGETKTSLDGTEQVIIVNISTAVLSALQSLQAKGLSVKDYFTGSASYFLSVFAVHEFAHAGAQTRKLLRPGGSMDSDLMEKTHPQIYAFHERYASLYNVAMAQGLGSGALILAVDLEKGVNLETYIAAFQREVEESKGKTP